MKSASVLIIRFNTYLKHKTKKNIIITSIRQKKIEIHLLLSSEYCTNVCRAGEDGTEPQLLSQGPSHRHSATEHCRIPRRDNWVPNRTIVANINF